MLAMSFAAALRSNSVRIAGAAALVIAIAPASQAAQVNFNLGGGTGTNLSSYNFTSGGVNMTVATSVPPNTPTSPQSTVSYTAPGVCLYALSTTASRCNGAVGSTYNNLAFTFNTDVNLLSFNIGQSIGSSATVFGGFDLISNGVKIGSTGSFSQAVNGSRIAFTSPVFLKAGSTVVFNGISAPNNSSLRINDLVVDTVPAIQAPGPLSILGAGAAFRASRRLRKRISRKASIV